MFGSSSSSIARTVAQTSTAVSSRSFTSSAAALKNRKVLVELLEDHPKYGAAHDKVLVAPGYARHHLIQWRKARLVPFYQRFKIRTERHVPEATITDPNLLITMTDKLPKQKPTAPAERTPQSLIDTLHLLPDTLLFPLRTIEADPEMLHGSLTLPDIQTRLATYALSEADVDVSWTNEEEKTELMTADGSRMKRIGRRTAEVRVRGRGRESVNVTISVVPLEQAA